jgi:hypothetical protein
MRPCPLPLPRPRPAVEFAHHHRPSVAQLRRSECAAYVLFVHDQTPYTGDATQCPGEQRRSQDCAGRSPHHSYHRPTKREIQERVTWERAGCHGRGEALTPDGGTRLSRSFSSSDATDPSDLAHTLRATKRLWGAVLDTLLDAPNVAAKDEAVAVAIIASRETKGALRTVRTICGSIAGCWTWRSAREPQWYRLSRVVCSGRRG